MTWGMFKVEHIEHLDRVAPDAQQMRMWQPTDGLERDILLP